MIKLKFPRIIECYHLIAQDGKPPFPDHNPVESEIATSKTHADLIKTQFKDRHPEAWILERPMISV